MRRVLDTYMYMYLRSIPRMEANRLLWTTNERASPGVEADQHRSCQYHCTEKRDFSCLCSTSWITCIFQKPVSLKLLVSHTWGLHPSTTGWDSMTFQNVITKTQTNSSHHTTLFRGERSGWCPSRVRSIVVEASIPLNYVASLLPSYEPEPHRGCRPRKCLKRTSASKDVSPLH